MTMDDRNKIIVPVWLIGIMVSVITAAGTAWVAVQVKTARLEVRASHNENNIDMLRKEKVSKEQFNTILDLLKGIEKQQDEMRRQQNEMQVQQNEFGRKLDAHIRDTR
jgi:lipopolysaccharide export LptBFGC system permease protein LptF